MSSRPRNDLEDNIYTMIQLPIRWGLIGTDGRHRRGLGLDKRAEELNAQEYVQV